MINDDLKDDPKWKAIRFAAFSRDLFTCQLCLIQKKQLECHHIKRKSEFPNLKYVLSNLISLCKECHESVTNREELFCEQFQKIISQKKLQAVGNVKHHKKTNAHTERLRAINKWRPTNPRLKM